MNNSYSVLAKYYNKFTAQDCDYVSWSQYLLQIANKFNAKNVADIACGTGKITKLLVENGMRVTAIDRSVEMLSEAMNECRATFVNQDMRKLQLLRPADMAVCVNDGVNYLKQNELSAFFKRVAENLKQGAPFVFDVSSEFKLTNVIGDNVFYLDEETETLLWTNKCAKTSVTMDLALFVKKGDMYRRFDERHVQYVHKQAEIELALTNAGFKVAEVTSNYGQPLNGKSQRITFYAVKTENN